MSLSPWIRLLRPKQSIKNALVFAPLLFARHFMSLEEWYISALAALTFLCISCLTYIANDIRDMGEDRLHPVKRRRPLAAKEIPVASATLLASAFAAAACFILTGLPYACAVVALVYIGLNLCYTLWLKRLAIIDIFCISFCYVLRVLMGCYAIDVTVSPWIILTTFLLALFLGFGKRYHEMGVEEYASAKPNLKHYSRSLLDRLVTITGGATLITYAIYTTEISKKTGGVDMVYSLVFVAFGLFRYLQSIYVYNQGGEPESIILKDRLQQANMALWLLMTLWILY